MVTPLRVLLVEDSEDDAELLLRILFRAGYELKSARVETPQAMSEALEMQIWDVVIADYSLPRFNGLAALNLLKARGLDLPFIMVSGGMTEELGSSAMHNGAHDYVMKDNLNRLVPAIQRELREAHGRRERRNVEWALQVSEERLQLARDIQQKLFPIRGPRLAGFDVHGASFPAEATSGDYFDYIPMSDGSVGVVIADVSGHGFGPALLMAETRAYLRALATSHTNAGEILTCANRLLAADTGGEHFVTLFFLKLDSRASSFVYAGAGHRSFHVDALGATTRLDSTGMILGIVPDARIECAPPRELRPGELIVMVTDGISETQAPDGTFFGMDRTLDVVCAHRGLPARTIVEKLYEAVHAFSQGHPQKDDLTAVVIRACR